LKISQALVDELIAHAREDFPNECCGMIEGVDGVATAVHRVKNEAESPLRYEMESKERYRAWKSIEDADAEFLAIYHSHTKSPAYPSQTDVNQAVNWPDQIYVIVSLEDRDSPDVRAFWLKDLTIAEAELVVE
jgi:[CysO sulfur-carrier protein]-S-L-cysteine hydrolase